MSSEGSAESVESHAPAGPSAPKGPLLVTLANTVMILAALGTFVYTRILFKRPQITESAERTRIIAEAQKHQRAANSTLGQVFFDPITANIKSNPDAFKSIDGPDHIVEGSGKIHYATVAFTLEIKDADQKDLIEQLRPRITDQILSMLGHKDFKEMTTVQGRYLIRTQILDMVNDLVSQQAKVKTTLATNVFFTIYIVQ